MISIRRIPILVRLHLLTIPLIVMGLVVALITRSSLRKNPRELLQAREVEELSVRSLALLLTRDDASKTLILNPADPGAQTRKIEAYSENQRVLQRIRELTESPQILSLTQQLGDLDEHQLRPLDQKVLALRNTGDIGQTIETFYSQYEPARKTYEGKLRELVDTAEKAAAFAAKNVEAHNQASLRIICGALGVGTLLAVLIVSLCARYFIGLPVRRISAEMLAIAHEQAYARELCEAKRTDELGDAARAFNAVLQAVRDSMDALRQANAHLEERVHERTAALEQANAKRAAVNRASLDGVLVLDAAWRIQEFNPAAQKVFGCEPQRAIARPLLDFIQPNDEIKGLFRPPAGGAIEERKREASILGRRLEVAAVRADGTQFPAEIAITTVEVEGEALYVASVRDVSERKTAEVEREDLHNRLMSASRRAGMAEVATGVLHNVGNVMNSVNVSANVIAKLVRGSEVDSLAKATDLIREHEHDLPQFLTQDKKGRLLPGFFIELARCLRQEQETTLKELEGMERGLEHIKSIITAQQANAKCGVVREKVEPAELAEAALELRRESFSRHAIEVVREYGQMGEAHLDKHKVLQILVNLLSNAKDALCESMCAQRRIVVSVHQIGEGPSRRIQFCVKDNGTGIAKENFAKIFSHGFTTRAKGHGFGLHSAANAAREMGGDVVAESEGPGRGATFTLSLPAGAAEASQLSSANEKVLV